MLSPCFMCPDRDYPKCYGYCKKYLEFKQSRAVVKAAKEKEHMLDAFHAKGVQRARKYMHDSKER